MSFRPPLAAPQPGSRLRHVLEAGKRGRLASSQAATGVYPDDGYMRTWSAADMSEVMEMWDWYNTTSSRDLSLKFYLDDDTVINKEVGALDIERKYLEMEQGPTDLENKMIRRHAKGSTASTDWVYVGDDKDLQEWAQHGLIRALLSDEVPGYRVNQVDYKIRYGLNDGQWNTLLSERS